MKIFSILIILLIVVSLEANEYYLRTTPPFTEVFIKGKSLGLTPLKIKELKEGKYVVKFKNPLFDEVEKEIYFNGEDKSIVLNEKKTFEEKNKNYSENNIAPNNNKKGIYVFGILFTSFLVSLSIYLSNKRNKTKKVIVAPGLRVTF